VPAPGDELFVDGGSVGVITSAIAAGDRVAALASIKRGFEAPSAATIEIGGQSVTADVAAVHWA